MIDLDKNVKYIKGVGPNRELLLNKLGIYTLKDLITYYPRTYEDRSKSKNLIECVDGEECLIEAVACGKITNSRIKGKTMQKLIVRDETATATIIWFNQSYLKDKFEERKKIQILWKNKKFFWKNNYHVTCF